MYGYIYLTTNLINGRKYIGQKRGEFNPNYYGSGLVLKQALKKYGKENFKIEILEYAKTREELNELEKHYINLNDACNNKEFYNIHEGGHGGNTKAGYTEEQMKAFKLKVSMGQRGRRLSEKQKEYLRIINTGERNAMYGRVSAMKGKTHTPEARRKISEAHKGKPKPPVKEESKRKLSASLRRHYSDPKNREKCARKDEANGMATAVRVTFPWGEIKEFPMIKSMAEYMLEHYDVKPKTTTRLARSQEPWMKIKRLKHKHLEGLKIEKI